MITITTQQKRIELRLQFSFAGIERLWKALTGLLNFSRVREIEKQKQEMMHDAGFNHWWI